MVLTESALLAELAFSLFLALSPISVSVEVNDTHDGMVFLLPKALRIEADALIRAGF